MTMFQYIATLTLILAAIEFIFGVKDRLRGENPWHCWFWSFLLVLAVIVAGLS